MPSLPMFLEGSDVELLLSHLDADEELAWVIGGFGNWVASPQRPAEVRTRSALWHIPAGSLPLPDADPFAPPAWVEDPWRGWSEARITDPDVPWFGGPCPRYYWLNLHTSQHEPLPISSFEWTGSRYRQIGQAAHPATEQHWRRLGRWVSKVSVKVPRSGPLTGPRREIHAFPEALSAIEAGRGRALYPKAVG